MSGAVERHPTIFIPHGGGPCFFMDDPRGMWTSLAEFLRGLPASLPAPPVAILVVSGHWETTGFAFTGAERPSLLYDYYGFPPHTYQLRFPAPGAPDLAARATGLLRAAGLAAAIDAERGLDHGVFVPLKVAWPDAEVPVVEMSVDASLDPALHLAAGRALAPLRDEGVLILGSGMSFHNMRSYGNPAALASSAEFDRWLTDAVAKTGTAGDAHFGISVRLGRRRRRRGPFRRAIRRLGSLFSTCQLCRMTFAVRRIAPSRRTARC